MYMPFPLALTYTAPFGRRRVVRLLSAMLLLTLPLLAAAEPLERRPWGEWEPPREESGDLDGHLGRYNPWNREQAGSYNPLREQTAKTHPWQRLSEEGGSLTTADPIWPTLSEERRDPNGRPEEGQRSKICREYDYCTDSLRESRRTLSSEGGQTGLRERVYSIPSLGRSRSDRRDRYTAPQELDRWTEERDERWREDEPRYRPRDRYRRD